MQWGTKASCQQPALTYRSCEWVISEMALPDPIKPSDDYSLGHHLSIVTFGETWSQNRPAMPLSDSWCSVKEGRAGAKALEWKPAWQV